MPNQTMAYMAKKFSNIRFKRNHSSKTNGGDEQGSSGFNKGKGAKDGKKGGYRTRSVDRSKIWFFNYNELGHFPTECKKPK